MRDEVFIRGDVPMTKSEVRAVVLSKLSLKPDSVLVDVGAGTGSVSVEAAAILGKGTVTAIEKEPEACRLVKQNIEKFGAANVTVICGRAAAVLKEIKQPAPYTHAFIGGTGGEMTEVLELLLAQNPEIRVVATAISLETVSQLCNWLDTRGIEAEIIQVQVSKAKKTGGHRLMMALNPIFVISFGKEE